MRRGVDPLGLVRALRLAVPFGVVLFVVLWIGGTQVFAEPGPPRAMAGETTGALPPIRAVRSGSCLSRRAYPASGDAVVIGITDYDIESTSLGIQHVFAFRDSQHHAVVSSAQIGANGFDRIRGHSRHERVRKLVAREIGFLYFKRSESTDLHSLVRSMMWRLHDIDALREQL
jgi:hypothetical protein